MQKRQLAKGNFSPLKTFRHTRHTSSSAAAEADPKLGELIGVAAATAEADPKFGEFARAAANAALADPKLRELAGAGVAAAAPLCGGGRGSNVSVSGCSNRSCTA